VGTPLASDDDGEPLSDPCDRHTQLRDQADLAYARDLGTPGFGDTVDRRLRPDQSPILPVPPDLNPTRIVPAGPVVSGWLEPHDRQRFGGSPFGDGAPPGPPPPEEIVAADHTPLVVVPA
jgi:putative glutathione S-transferase